MSAILEAGRTQDADTQNAGFVNVCLLSFLGMLISFVVLLSSSEKTIASVTAALALM
jgi:hypothetical protein